LLREGREAGERMRVDPDRILARRRAADRVRRAPLGEARAERAVLLEARPEPVEPFRRGLARRERERLRAPVDLDPRDDAFRLEQLRERRPVRRALADRLVEEDDPADELGRSLGREEQLAVGAAVVL